MFPLSARAPHLTALVSLAAVVALPAALATSAAPTTAAPHTATADPVPREGDLLIANHGFESGGESWQFDTRGRCPSDAVGITDTQAAEGEQSLAFQTGGACRIALARSADVPVEPGEEYRGFVRVASEDAGVVARLVFLDADGDEVDTGSRGRSAAGDWSTLRLAGIAPDDATSVAVSVQTDPARPGTSYVDDVRVSAQWTNLGGQIHQASVNGAAYGLDADGRDTAYQVVTGSMSSDAHLVGVLMETGEVISDVALPGTWGAWNATTAPDGTIYVGSYSNGHLYRYVPGADAAVDLGQAIEGDSHIWDLRSGPDGTIYGGGYPSGGMFRWTEAEGFSQIGPRPVVAGEDYVRGIAYDPDLDLVYGGVGSHAHLMACEADSTATCTDILPDELRSLAFAYNVSAGDGYVFVRMENGGQTVVLQVTTSADGGVSAEQVADLGATDYPGGTDLSDGKFYYTKSGVLHSFDVTTTSETDLEVNTGIAARRWEVRELADQAEWQGRTVVGVNSGGVMVRYGIDTQQVEIVPSIDLPGSPVDINQLLAGPDDQMYTVGYLVGGMGVYEPLRGEGTELWPVGQAEGATVVGDEIYLGIYPKANIQAYRPGEPVEAGTNPREVCSLDHAEQDRPYAMTTGGDDRVYIGTMAAYGKLPGALSIYDPATEGCEVVGDVVPEQTISALTWHEGMVYGGSLIWGGLGIEPTQDEAMFFRYDPSTGETTQYELPVRGLRGVFGVTPGPAGKIWMIAENYLLVFDPATETWEHVSQPWAHLDYEDLPNNGRITAFDAFLRLSPDGEFYGTIHGAEFFRIDPSSHTVTTLWTGGANHIALDEYGNVYFNHQSTDLVRYAP